MSERKRREEEKERERESELGRDGREMMDWLVG